MTDVWTSTGVIVGVLLVALTGIQRLDPVIAFAVGLNIFFTGWKLLREPVEGLINIAMTREDNAVIADVLTGFVTPEVHLHALRTRESGDHRFAEVHVLVPGAWSVQQGHDLVEDVEAAVHARFPDVALTCHLEPSEDPRAYGDYAAEFRYPPTTTSWPPIRATPTRPRAAVPSRANRLNRHPPPMAERRGLPPGVSLISFTAAAP